jgi:hypothetical protein
VIKVLFGKTNPRQQMLSRNAVFLGGLSIVSALSLLVSPIPLQKAQRPSFAPRTRQEGFEPASGYVAAPVRGRAAPITQAVLW